MALRHCKSSRKLDIESETRLCMGLQSWRDRRDPSCVSQSWRGMWQILRLREDDRRVVCLLGGDKVVTSSLILECRLVSFRLMHLDLFDLLPEERYLFDDDDEGEWWYWWWGVQRWWRCETIIKKKWREHQHYWNLILNRQYSMKRTLVLAAASVINDKTEQGAANFATGGNAAAGTRTREASTSFTGDKRSWRLLEIRKTTKVIYDYFDNVIFSE